MVYDVYFSLTDDSAEMSRKLFAGLTVLACGFLVEFLFLLLLKFASFHTCHAAACGGMLNVAPNSICQNNSFAQAHF